MDWRILSVYAEGRISKHLLSELILANVYFPFILFARRWRESIAIGQERNLVEINFQFILGWDNPKWCIFFQWLSVPANLQRPNHKELDKNIIFYSKMSLSVKKLYYDCTTAWNVFWQQIFRIRFDWIFSHHRTRNVVKGFHWKGSLTINTAANNQRCWI